MSLKSHNCPKCKAELFVEINRENFDEIDFIPVTCPKCEYSAILEGLGDKRKLRERKKVTS